MLTFNVLFVLFSVAYAIFILRYLYYWLDTKTSVIDKSQGTRPISIVIAVRNEAIGIKACIDSILNQAYPEMEIIVIDDFSSDQTAEIVGSYTQTNIRCYRLEEILSKDAKHSMNKKAAIEYGVHQARYDIIVTIDGDCIASEEWLLHFSNAFSDNKIMYATGIVSIVQHKNFFEAFQQLDLLSLTGITAASIKMKSAYMSNGANMAFRKSAFLDIGGYTLINKIPTGDDVFLMHKIIQRYGDDACVFIKNENASVFTEACYSIETFIQQRIRWVSKSSSLLSKKVTITLVFMYVYHSLFLVSAVCGMLVKDATCYLLLAFFLWKISFDLLFLNSVSSYFKKKQLLIWLPIFEIFYIFYVVMIGLLGWRGKYTWKNRSI